MDDSNLIKRTEELTAKLRRLLNEVSDFQDFNRELQSLKHEYADILLSKQPSVRMRLSNSQRHKVSDKRALLAVEKAEAEIDSTNVTLDIFDLRLLEPVANVGSELPEASVRLRDSLANLKQTVAALIRDATTEGNKLDVRAIAVTGIEALDLRDALESALVDTSALHAYDQQLSREGDAGRGGYVVGSAVIREILNRFEPPTVRGMLVPSAKEFQIKLTEILATATKLELVAIEVNAEKLHLLVGQYPGPKHRIPMCCKSMLFAMQRGDKVVSTTPTDDRPSLTIRYRLPRQG